MLSNRLLRLLFLTYSFFLCIPSVARASIQDSTNRNLQSEGVIYVSGGTIIYGVSNISYGTIEKITVTKLPKEKKDSKPGKNIISKQDVRKSVASRETLKKIRENQKRAIPVNFTSSPNRDHIINSKHSQVRALAPSHTNFTFKLYGDLEEGLLVFNKFTSQSGKQKFSFSQSYLQFSKLLNSFLRGPPAKLVS